MLPSCGKRAPLNYKGSDPTFITFSEVKCHETQTNEVSQNIKNIDKFIINTNKFEGSYQRMNGFGFSLWNQVEFESGSSEKRPLKISEASLNSEFILLKGKISKSFSNNFYNSVVLGEKIKGPVTDSWSSLNQIGKEINSLRDKLNRWKAAQCSLYFLEQKSKNDVRTYMNLKENSCEISSSEGCLERQLVNYKKLPLATQRSLKKSLMSLCLEQFMAPLCEADFAQSLREKNLLKFSKFYLEAFKKRRVDKLFSIAYPRKFKCEKKESGKVIIKIPFYLSNSQVSSFSGGAKGIFNFIENKWKNSNVEIKLINAPKFVQNKTLNIQFTNLGVSTVDERRPKTMNIDRRLTGYRLAQTISHEFGHVLGFPDCYIQFFDRKSSELVYYELDHGRQNIMCSTQMGYKAPASYLDELAEKSCQF